MTETLAQWFTDNLGGVVANELIIFIVSMVPILELRGGMIVARLLNISILRALPICIIGNIIPVPFILWFITPIFNWMKKRKLFRGLVEKLENNAVSKSDKVEKYQFWGLLIFVGIPLPGTGAWTGALIASILGIKWKKAFPAIILGVFMAAAIMSVISYLIPYLLGA